MNVANITMDKYTSQLADSVYKHEFTELLQKLIADYYNVNNLPYQLQTIGSHVHGALPLAPGQGSVTPVLYHLLGDLEGTELFTNFKQWVTSLIAAFGDQEKKLGAIVQVSGYGKTHLARTYTSTHRAIYILFTNELASADDARNHQDNKRKVLEFFDEKFAAFKDAETCLKNVNLDDSSVVEKEFARVLRVSELCRRIVRLFLLAAVEYYTDFIEIATPLITAFHPVGNGTAPDHPDVLKLGSLLFNNKCLYFFLNSKLPSLYTHYYNDMWWDSYIEYVRNRQSEYRICAIFCDEVHGVLKRHVGLCLHENVHQAIPRDLPVCSSKQGNLKQIFDSYDVDKDGYLLLADFERLCNESLLPGLPESPSMYWQNDVALQSYPAMSFTHFLGLFSSTDAQEKTIRYDAKLQMLRRRKYEANEASTCGKNPAFEAQYHDVISVYKHSTSLTYLIANSLDFMTKTLRNFSSICLTTNYSAIQYYEQNNNTARGSLLFNVFNFDRDPSHLFNQYSKLIEHHFGKYLTTILSDAKLRDAFSIRSLYMAYLFGALLKKASNASEALEEAIRDCKDRARSYLAVLEGPPFLQLYHQAVLSVMLHNCVLAQSLDPKHELDHGCLPVVKKSLDEKHFVIKDYFMCAEIQEKVTANYDLLATAIHTCFNDQPNLADKFGDALMAYIALKYNGKSLRSISVPQSFYTQGPQDAVPRSFINNAVIQVESCMTTNELDVDDLMLLNDPLKYMKGKLVKLQDTTKPDGLSLTVSGSNLIATAWQSKYWAFTISASDLTSAALSLNPAQFFKETDNNSTTWRKNLMQNKQLNQLWIGKYIRVFIARKFVPSAVKLVDSWNLHPENVDYPILLVQFEDHLVTDIEKELLSMKQVKEDMDSIKEKSIHSIKKEEEDGTLNNKAKKGFMIALPAAGVELELHQEEKKTAPTASAEPRHITKGSKRKHEESSSSEGNNLSASEDGRAKKRRRLTTKLK